MDTEDHKLIERLYAKAGKRDDVVDEMVIEYVMNFNYITYEEAKRLVNEYNGIKESWITLDDGRHIYIDDQKTGSTGNAIIDKAVGRYGTTDDVDKAGYILPNGKLLDMSKGKSVRQMEHSDVKEILPDSLQENPVAMFTKEAGAISFSGMRGSDFHITLRRDAKPTPSQLKTVRDIIAQGTGNIWYTITDEAGNAVLDSSQTTKFSDVLKKLGNYREMLVLWEAVEIGEGFVTLEDDRVIFIASEPGQMDEAAFYRDDEGRLRIIPDDSERDEYAQRRAVALAVTKYMDKGETKTSIQKALMKYPANVLNVTEITIQEKPVRAYVSPGSKLAQFYPPGAGDPYTGNVDVDGTGGFRDIKVSYGRGTDRAIQVLNHEMGHSIWEETKSDPRNLEFHNFWDANKAEIEKIDPYLSLNASEFFAELNAMNNQDRPNSLTYRLAKASPVYMKGMSMVKELVRSLKK